MVRAAPWSDALDLCDEHQEPYRPSPHMFRHTYATALVNRDVDLFAVQSLLDHGSREMTCRYARLSKETVRRKWEQGQQRINIRGQVVPLRVDGELSDAAWAKEEIARAKQTLPNGYCPATRGDSDSPLRWTSKSGAKLAQALRKMGHDVVERTMLRLLKAKGYSLQANKKTREGAQHPDGDAQCADISQSVSEAVAEGNR